MQPVTIQQWLKHAGQKLSSITDAFQEESHTILSDALQKNTAYLIAHSDDVLDNHIKNKIDNHLHQRLTQKPLAYILGHTTFYGLPFKVNEHVLIPRNATESLVEYTLKHFDHTPIKVADLGTGSGAIACTLAHHRKEWEIIASDISKEALAIASHNAHHLHVQNITFLQSNWFEQLTYHDFDVIISNPPYIDFKDSDIDFSVTHFEPHLALFSNHHGLFDIEIILRESKNYLKPHGKLIIEHGHEQQKTIIQLAQHFHYKKIQGYKDLSGLDRFITIQR